MPFISTFMMLVALLLVGSTAVLASPIATPYSQPASTSISNPACPTTVITYPTPVYGPTSTLYAHTSTITREYDCHGCEGLVVEQLGHVFPDIRISYTTTVTEYQPTTYIQAVCSSTSGNVQTESVTVSTTETAGYATVTVASKTGDMGLRDLLLETKSKTLSTTAAQRSGDFGGGHNPTRCIDYRTGKPIPGCNTAREVDEQQPRPGSIHPAPCWNPITGLFDPAQPGCKITSRSQMDGDAIGVHEFDIQERQNSNANATESCTSICNFIATDPDLPDSTGLPHSPADLAACVAQCVLFYHPGEDAQPLDDLSANHELEQRHTPQCVECPADGGKCISFKCPTTHKCVECPADGGECFTVDCPHAKRAVDVETEKHKVRLRTSFSPVCSMPATNILWTSGCVACPANGGECVSVKCPTTHKCVECPADGSECISVNCPTAKRAVDEQIQERQNPQCLVCAVDSDDACFEVDCHAGAGGRGGDEGQGDKRGVAPLNSHQTSCYSTCMSKVPKPTYQDINRCTLNCANVPHSVGNLCDMVKRAADIEVENVARQDSLYGHPGEDQVEGGHFNGRALVCSS